MDYFDSTGKPVHRGDIVRWRGKWYSIKGFIPGIGRGGCAAIEFDQERHGEWRNETPDEWGIDKQLCDTERPLTVEILEVFTGMPSSQWHGKCSELAIAAAALVGGSYAYGHYLGPVHADSYWSDRRYLPFIQHAWVNLPPFGYWSQGPDDLTRCTMDPTRWSFLDPSHFKPEIWIGVDACGEYDEGGQKWRGAVPQPIPPDDDGGDYIDISDMSHLAISTINTMLVYDAPRTEVNFAQMAWLVSGPLANIEAIAKELFVLLEKNDWKATVPADHWRMVMG